MLATVTVIITVILYVVIPKGLFPVQDVGVIEGISVADNSVSYAAMSARQAELADAILKDADVTSITSYIGIDGTNTTLNNGRFLINLKAHNDRSLSARQIALRLQNEVANISGIKLYLQPEQDLTLDTVVSPNQYQFVLRGPSQEAFQQYVPELVARMKQIKSIADVTSDLNNDGLSVNVEVNRQLAARYGITPATIDNALYDALGQRIVSTIFNQSNQYRVVLVAKPETLPNLQALGDLYLPTQTGSTGQVPLRGIADIKVTKSPLVISHLAQFPAVTVSFNLAPDASLSTAVDEIERAEQAMHLPPSITTSFQGAAQAFQDSLSSEVFLLAAALVTVYIVLGVLYESYIHPVTILSTLPVGGHRRAARADDRRQRPRRDRHHRHRALDRHRQEERHHDRRFRARGGAQARQIARGGDFRGLDAALSADPHDDARRHARRPAAARRQRHGLGAAPAAGARDHRRPAGEPDAHAVHHAGHLSDVRPHLAALRPQGERALGRAGRMNIPAIFINRPVATSLLAIAHRAVRPARLLPYAGRAAAERHAAGRSRCRRAWRERARKSWPRRSPSRSSGAWRPSPA